MYFSTGVRWFDLIKLQCVRSNQYLWIGLKAFDHEQIICLLTLLDLCDAQEGSPFALHIALDSDDEDDSSDEDEEEEEGNEGAVDVDVSQIELQNISLQDPERGEGSRAAGERFFTLLLAAYICRGLS